MPERLQKVLAQHGLGSRREIERWIADGRVTVNLQLAKVGEAYTPGDRVAIDGKEVTARLSITVPKQVLLYHKAQGQPITHDARSARPPESEAESDESFSPEDTKHEFKEVGTPVVDRLPAIRGSRWVAINPMHAGDSGLLLMTNDGALGYALTRHKREIPTAYMVRVLAPGDAESRMQGPPEIPPHVTYNDTEIEFTSVEPAGGEGSNLWYRVELPRADRRAAVRALFASHELIVSRMTQVAFGSIELPRDLPRGRHRALTTSQIEALYALAKLPPPVATAIVRTEAASGSRSPASRSRRSVAPDRSAGKKKAQRRAELDTITPNPRFAEDREGKRAAKLKVVTAKKVSTWNARTRTTVKDEGKFTAKSRGKKRPLRDSRR